MTHNTPKVNDPVQYTTDKAYKYNGFRFYVKEALDDGLFLIGRMKDDLVDVVTDAQGLKVVPKGQNKAVYE